MKTSRWLFIVPVLLALLAASSARAQEKETFTGMLVQTSGMASGKTGRLQLTVERWTTPEERQAYIEALLAGKNERSLEAKQQKLLDMMEDAGGAQRVGFARFPATLGWDLTYAWQLKEGATRIVRLITNRPVAFIEARNQYRTMDYPFGCVELRLNEKGEGEGLAFQAVSLTLSKDNALEVETFGIGPQKILGVKTEREKVKEK